MAKASLEDLPRYVKAVSGKFITVDDRTVRTDFQYREYERFELTWDIENGAGIVYWDNEGAHQLPIKLTKTDFNKFVKPVVKIFENTIDSGKLSRLDFNLRMRELNDRIFIAKLNDDLDLLEDLLILRKNVRSYHLVPYCQGCGRELDKCQCQS